MINHREGSTVIRVEEYLRKANTQIIKCLLLSVAQLSELNEGIPLQIKPIFCQVYLNVFK